MPLFVALSPGLELTPDMVDRISHDIRARISPRTYPTRW